MNEIDGAGVCRGGGKLKRFPDVSRADQYLLDQLEPELAREYRKVIRAESRSDRRQRRLVRSLRQQLERPRGRRPTFPPHE